MRIWLVRLRTLWRKGTPIRWNADSRRGVMRKTSSCCGWIQGIELLLVGLKGHIGSLTANIWAYIVVQNLDMRQTTGFNPLHRLVIHSLDTGCTLVFLRCLHLKFTHHLEHKEWPAGVYQQLVMEMLLLLGKIAYSRTSNKLPISISWSTVGYANKL